MTTSQDPDRIRADIERTRRNLSADVDTLAREANPTTIAKRKVGRMTSAVGGVRDRVMGSAQDAGSSLADAQSSAADAAQSAPRAVRRHTQGNPLAAGLIAFGAGLLVASMLPASEREQEAALAVKEKAEPLTQELTDVAKDAAQNLKEPAQNATQAVKETVTEAADTVKAEGTSAAQDVQGRAADAKDTVREQQR
ncbi:MULTISPECIES: DUF3618 domain-containing protein [Rhodococcus]|jgi:ElaB/YqjD/DUF883 family membrane-anchored ribosome-binding protein|uniref:DUF3618 domain-containing protein n=1 Tax=Rhodococcus oxybenzonivorans TaxID=1990687 RepID=A0AAE4V2F2_9NOCA|nr:MULTISPECIES: DUF3618 domain-containing protein [Rhodococcus]MDV7242912.1 DUF3618 domain-containing protein [Rhodococcus oxybenzonivorans]MDV7267012.1 DUF3618 domain-containing protein [Rhodococcus oxybenzonivorans]MDV7275316.1 DUF3618 domain-containing protein [Rhodococcus oxybenzonivorans]MDV7334829.1 DUF3618 domain-containing protein [Rhodococcus oxybenzonivorans]MDV7344983.1 DUF3618 domain-containing protein [Rhodococcus oxybenzonivorans]